MTMLEQIIEEQRLKTQFKHFSRDELRLMWDHVGDNGFFGPYDCQDIHTWMNITGDGSYCSV